MTVDEILTAAKQLPPEDRRLLVDELQETLPEEEGCLPLSPEWMAEIQRRAAELDAHPERAIPWEQVYERALAKIATYVDK
jgi:putative addiction module component (TIGR02574 family)